jgi:hypothetical protein
MKKLIITGAAVGLLALGFAAPAQAGDKGDKCNWGQLTSSAIADGFEQGPHASSFAGSKRSGLANVVNQGDLNATCVALS